MSKVIVVGSGNAALCAGIAALEKGAQVTIIEKACKEEAGGNSRYTAGAMRFAYDSDADLLPLLLNPSDDRLSMTEFGQYSQKQFESDLLKFNNGLPLSLHQQILVEKSYETLAWLGSHDIKFEPIYSRQSFKKDDKYIFWGGLTLEAKGEGVGLVDAELEEFIRMGGTILYETAGKSLITKEDKVIGITVETPEGNYDILADSIVLACGGFESNLELRRKYMGDNWLKSKVRGTRHNTGEGLEMALDIGAVVNGNLKGCHATPMDYNMPDYGNTAIPYIDRKHYRKICYFLGIMLNASGQRFVDEGINFRNYTYAQFGREILNQPKNVAWQFFDKKVDHLLYSEYRFWDTSFFEADTLEELIDQIDGIDKESAMQSIRDFNAAVNDSTSFDPSILDGKSTRSLLLNKTNWANTLDTPPYKAYPVTCGITFTYGGLLVDENAKVLTENHSPLKGLFACGEIVGGVFYHGYPGGSGLTSGAVFGRLAGYSAAQ